MIVVVAVLYALAGMTAAADFLRWADSAECCCPPPRPVLAAVWAGVMWPLVACHDALYLARWER